MSMALAAYTVEEIFTTGGLYPERPVDAPPTPAMRANALLLAARVTRLVEMYLHATQQPAEARPRLTSGYRPPKANAVAHGARRSNHMFCAAVDLEDQGDAFDAWCLANQSALDLCGLWLEHPESTPGWCHLQCVPPRSGARVFRV